MRFLFALLILVSASAQAAPPARPCPYMSAGWTQQYLPSDAITSVSYAADYQVLFVVFQNTIVSAYSGVPVSVMQSFAQTQNPMPLYNSVNSTYHAMLLWEIDNCPVLLENQTWCDILNEDNKTDVLSQSGGQSIQYEFPSCNLYNGQPPVLWSK